MPGPAAMEAVTVVLVLLGLGVVADVMLLVRWRRGGIPWARWHARLTARPWHTRHALFLAGCLILPPCLLQGLAAWGNSGASTTDTPPAAALLVGQTLAFHGMAALGIGWLLIRRKLNLNRAFGIAPGRLAADAARGLLLYVALWPPLAVVTLGWNLLLIYLGQPVTPQDVIGLLTQTGQPLWLQVYLSAVAVLAAPLIEELVFRGLALPVLARHVPPRVAIATVSLLFAAIHLHLPAFLPLALVGGAFAFGYLATGSMVTPIVMHMAFNGVSLLLAFKTRGWTTGA